MQQFEVWTNNRNAETFVLVLSSSPSYTVLTEGEEYFTSFVAASLDEAHKKYQEFVEHFLM